MLIVGSYALKYNLEKYHLAGNFREPKDLDVLCTTSEMASFCMERKLQFNQSSKCKFLARTTNGAIEFETTKRCVSAGDYVEYVRKFKNADIINLYGANMQIAPIEVLWSMKLSHRHSPRNWKKHIEDLMLMKHIVRWDSLDKTTKIREKETELRKTPSLNKTTKEFFDDNVSNRVFIHDEIHQVMAHYDRPLFEQIKVDPNLVKCDRNKFEALAFQDRIRCVLEEAYVIALERAVIPMIFSGGKATDRAKAFDYAIMRICTNLCNGWFREFATMNYEHIMGMYSPEYVDKFLTAVDNGRIKQIGDKHEVL